MEAQKLVTICVPTFNSQSTLPETLESILNQSHRNLVIKIFDNASTDGTLGLAEKFALKDSRIQVFSNPTNIGAEGNFNRCLQAAEGDFTAIFHADDVYETSMIESQVEFLISHTECSAVAAQATVIDALGNSQGVRFLPPELRGSEETTHSFEDLFFLTLKYGNFITCPSVMAKSSVYRDVIKTWDGSNFGSSADLDVWLRLSKVGRFGLLTKPLMRYRVSEASFTVRETKRRFTEHDLLKVYRNYLGPHTFQDPEKLRYLRFHEFKDAAARRLNILQARRRDLVFPKFPGHVLSLFPLVFKSRYHFKFLIVSYMIFFISETFRILRVHK